MRHPFRDSDTEKSSKTPAATTDSAVLRPLWLDVIAGTWFVWMLVKSSLNGTFWDHRFFFILTTLGSSVSMVVSHVANYPLFGATRHVELPFPCVVMLACEVSMCAW